jgi:DNA-binding LytR/AlgR family response regulator
VAWITGLGAAFVFFLAHTLETAGLVRRLRRQPEAQPDGPHAAFAPLLARRGRAYVPLAPEAIAYLFTSGKTVFARDRHGTTHRLDGRLRELEAVLPGDFFRVNRAWLVHRRAVASFRTLPNGRLAVTLDPEAPQEVIISREKAKRFREWMTAS